MSDYRSNPVAIGLASFVLVNQGILQSVYFSLLAADIYPTDEASRQWRMHKRLYAEIRC
ncbi:MAG: hypothetical protein HY785_12895 [Oscillatoriophycideae cyanobacterium NC_groundwater_1537_Pr4_S-0.65um_50_18]|nr:hypothetical protein [Oscillatoriophycideae cyanobacterium NC_groundwater_1537_Pr4_S-0.65um_50_18]